MSGKKLNTYKNNTFIENAKYWVTKLTSLEEKVENQKSDDSQTIAALTGGNSYHYVYYVSPSGNDNYTVIKTACADAKLEQDTNGTKVLVYVREGVYNEYQVNQLDVDMYFEDGAILYTDRNSYLSVLFYADAGAGYTGDREQSLNIYGKGTFFTKYLNVPNAICSFSISPPNIQTYVEAKFIDTAQHWDDNNPDGKTVYKGVSFFNAHNLLANAELIDCTFLNTFSLNGYITDEVNIKFTRCNIYDPKQLGGNGRHIYDKSGSLVATIQPVPSSSIADGTSRSFELVGTSGTSDFTIETVNYPIIFNTDIETTVDDWITTNAAALLATDSAIDAKRRKQVTLTGTSGTANITIDGIDYLTTFNTDVTTTVDNFISTHGSTIGTQGFTVSNNSGVLIITKDTEATFATSVTNVSGDLAGTIVHAFQLKGGYILRNTGVRHYFYFDFDTSSTNTSGDLALTENYIGTNFTDIKEYINTNRFHNVLGYGAYMRNTTSGQATQVAFNFSRIILERRNSIGLNIINRKNTIARTAVTGSLQIDGLRILDRTGDASKETTAIVKGENNNLTSPQSITINQFYHDCKEAIYQRTVAPYDNIPVIKSDNADLNTN